MGAPENMQLVIIDLHCDPTIPAGANEAGGGNVYMRQLLKGLEHSGIQAIYITRKKYPTLESRTILPNGYNKDFLSNTRKAQNTVRQSSKHTISCVKCSGMPGVPFQIYTKFTPFEEKLDVGFKFLAGQKKGREYRD